MRSEISPVIELFGIRGFSVRDRLISEKNQIAGAKGIRSQVGVGISPYHGICRTRYTLFGKGPVQLNIYCIRFFLFERLAKYAACVKRVLRLKVAVITQIQSAVTRPCRTDQKEGSCRNKAESRIESIRYPSFAENYEQCRSGDSSGKQKDCLPCVGLCPKPEGHTRCEGHRNADKRRFVKKRIHRD